LLVVARLAARHGIRVRLNQADLGGLTALVWLPDEILTHYSAAAGPGHPAAASRGAKASPRAFVPARMDQPAAQPGPAWSARGPQATAPAASPGARLSAVGRQDVPARPVAAGRDGPTGFPRRAGQGRTARPEEGNPGGPDEF
jgi:hypothetical protein